MANQSIYSSDTLHLQEEAFELFDGLGTVKSYDKNTTLYLQAEQADCFYYLQKGSVKVFFNSAEGMQKTISIAGNGSVLGEAAFFDRMPRVSSAQTISHCIINTVTHQQLEEAIKKNPKLAMCMLRVQAQSIRMLSAQVSGMVFTKAECRIAGQLLHSKAVLNNEFIVNLTHEEIGNLVGVSRVTVSKILNELAGKGILKTAYRYIVINDLERLEEIAYVE